MNSSGTSSFESPEASTNNNTCRTPNAGTSQGGPEDRRVNDGQAIMRRKIKTIKVKRRQRGRPPSSSCVSAAAASKLEAMCSLKLKKTVEPNGPFKWQRELSRDMANFSEGFEYTFSAARPLPAGSAAEPSLGAAGTDDEQLTCREEKVVDNYSSGAVDFGNQAGPSSSQGGSGGECGGPRLASTDGTLRRRPAIHIKEDIREIGHKVWDVAVCMSKMFEYHPELVAGKRIIEFGVSFILIWCNVVPPQLRLSCGEQLHPVLYCCPAGNMSQAGTGLLGLVAHYLGASAVMCTEYSRCIEWLTMNVKHNRQENSGEIATCMVDWNLPLPPDVAGFESDLILAADITLSPRDAENIVGLVKRLHAVSPRALILMGCNRMREGQTRFEQEALLYYELVPVRALSMFP
eukprot:INCI4209.1.p1 GENE.INCI4209.1~~INCI4209.1.p1  ORF type:complete len:405 (-),score=50.33 INCI4209.1:617-1831(-)